MNKKSVFIILHKMILINFLFSIAYFNLPVSSKNSYSPDRIILDQRTIVTLKDRSIAICGNIFSNSSKKKLNNAFIIKLKDNFDVMWQKVYASNLETRLINAIEADDKGIIAVGQVQVQYDKKNTIFGPPTGMIFRIDEEGNILWKKIIKEVYVFRQILKESNNIYYAIGQLRKGGNIIIKFNQLGKILWQKKCDNVKGGFDQGIEANDDGFILLGAIDKSISTPNMMNLHNIIAKFNNNGEIEWQKSYGIDGMTSIGRLIKSSKNNGYFVFSESEDSDGKTILWIYKIREDGEIEWQKTYSDLNSNQDKMDSNWLSLNNAIQIEDGNFLISGGDAPFINGVGKPWMMQMYDNGNVKWAYKYKIDNAYLEKIFVINKDLILLKAKYPSNDIKQEYYFFCQLNREGVIRNSNVRKKDLIIKVEISKSIVEDVNAPIYDYSTEEIENQIRAIDITDAIIIIRNEENAKVFIRKCN